MVGTFLGKSFAIASVVIIIFSVVLTTVSLGYRVYKYPGGQIKAAKGGGGGMGDTKRASCDEEKRPLTLSNLSLSQVVAILCLLVGGPVLITAAIRNVIMLSRGDGDMGPKYIEPVLTSVGIFFLITCSILNTESHFKLWNRYVRWRASQGYAELPVSL